MRRFAVQMSGFVLVKKVPGSLHFHMRQSGLSFETEDIDVSHVVHAFTFGNRPSPKRLRTLARLHPGGLNKDWADKLQVRPELPDLCTHACCCVRAAYAWRMDGHKQRSCLLLCVLWPRWSS